MQLLQSRALPLGYVAKKLIERETGIEPATFSLARRCSTTEPLPLITLWDSPQRRYKELTLFARLRYHTFGALSTAFAKIHRAFPFSLFNACCTSQVVVLVRKVAARWLFHSEATLT
jgi:hypothetical protein